MFAASVAASLTTTGAKAQRLQWASLRAPAAQAIASPDLRSTVRQINTMKLGPAEYPRHLTPEQRAELRRQLSQPHGGVDVTPRGRAN